MEVQEDLDAAMELEHQRSAEGVAPSHLAVGGGRRGSPVGSPTLAKGSGSKKTKRER